MARKSLEERLQNLEEKRKQLEAKEQRLRSIAKEKERKERTRRLIQIGAIMDSIGIDTLEKAEKYKEFFKKVLADNKAAD